MSEPIFDQTVEAFLDKLASEAPTPGGGSVAALSGAMGAALVAMVCNLTIGKQQFEQVQREMLSVRERAEHLRTQLQRLAQADVEVFARLMAAYKLPRVTEADAASRRAAIQRLTRDATETPLQTARAAADVLPLCATVARYGNRSVISDAGVAALMAQSAVHSALLNVEINLAVLEDPLYVNEVRASIEDLVVGLVEETRGVLELVRERMAM
jgi:formiminotetrahydrofolate cyclodeaminase